MLQKFMLLGISAVLFRLPSVVCFSNRRQSSVLSHKRSLSSHAMTNLIVAQFPCLSDNYGYLLHDPSTGNTAAIDTPDARAYTKVLQEKEWKLTHILNTHHHHDHTGGNMALKTDDSVTVYGPASERIPGRDVALSGGDCIEFGSHKAEILGVGGHTKGHIAYYFKEQKKVFVGDSLFALGCGRMFEGTPDQFWKSLQTLRDLPNDTDVYCAHEYTLSNAKFAMSVEPNNQALQSRFKEVQKLRDKNIPTVPSKMGMEKQTNPFLRCDTSDEIRKNVGVRDGDSDATAFAKTRAAKDSF